MTEEILKEVIRLQEIKKKNESQIPAELLQTKYKRSYDRLCSELKEKQCQLRTEYTKRVRILADIMANSVYAEDPEEFLKYVNEQHGDEMLPDTLDLMFFNVFWDYLKTIRGEETRSWRQEIADKVQKMIEDKNYMINTGSKDEKQMYAWEYARKHLLVVLKMLRKNEGMP